MLGDTKRSEVILWLGNDDLIDADSVDIPLEKLFGCRVIVGKTLRTGIVKGGTSLFSFLIGGLYMKGSEADLGMKSMTPPSDDYMVEFSVTIHEGCLDLITLGNNYTKKAYMPSFVKDVFNVVKRYSLMAEPEKELDPPLLNKGSVRLHQT